MPLYLFAAAVGIALISLLPSLSVGLLVAVSLAALVSAAAGWVYRRRLLLALGCLLLGAAWATGYGLWLLHHLLPVALEQQAVVVTGTVEGLPQRGLSRGEPTVRFELAVDRAECGGAGSCARFPRRLRLSWREPPSVVPGQRWRLMIKAKRPHGFMNPGGFDYQTWLVRRGIGATGYVLSDGDHRRLGQRRPLDYWRWHLAGVLDQQLRELRYADVLKALLIADKRDIASSDWQFFRRHGIIHLMVISGLHVGLVSGLAFALTRWVSVLAGVARHADRVAAVAAIATALVYCLAAGASLPTRRALVMVTTYMLMLLLRREPVSGTGFGLALVLCLGLEPLAVMSPSFWLSFLAVLLLIMGFAGRIRRLGPLWVAVRSQWLVFVGLAPVLAAGFGQVSTHAPLVNLAAVPLFSLLVVPGNLLALALSVPCPAIALWLWDGCDRLLILGLGSLHWLDARWDLTLLDLPAAPWWWQCLGLAGVLLLVLPRGLPLRPAGLMLLLPLLLYPAQRPGHGAVDVSVLDVGQGLSVVVATANHLLVYDVGARYRQGRERYFSVAEAALLPYLRHRGRERVDALVLSHSDNDHAGAWPDLLRNLPVKRVITGETIEPLAADSCHRPRRWQWDGVRFRFFVLNAGLRSKRRASTNNHSCILSIEAGGHRFLLPGDIDSGVEKALVRQFGGQLQAQVLLAPHHGSRSSSSWAFVKTVRPDHVVYSTGYRNPFDHPAPTVVERYHHFVSDQHNTGRHGAILFQVRRGKLLTPAHFRQRKHGYWL